LNAAIAETSDASISNQVFHKNLVRIKDHKLSEGQNTFTWNCDEAAGSSTVLYTSIQEPPMLVSEEGITYVSFIAMGIGPNDFTIDEFGQFIVSLYVSS
jgi:hypothetical protein